MNFVTTVIFCLKGTLVVIVKIEIIVKNQWGERERERDREFNGEYGISLFNLCD